MKTLAGMPKNLHTSCCGLLVSEERGAWAWRVFYVGLQDLITD